jgi:hypothetical protein
MFQRLGYVGWLAEQDRVPHEFLGLAGRGSGGGMDWLCGSGGIVVDSNTEGCPSRAG